MTDAELRAFVVKDVTMAEDRMCALSTEGTVACWWEAIPQADISQPGRPHGVEGLGGIRDIALANMRLYILADDGSVSSVETFHPAQNQHTSGVTRIPGFEDVVSIRAGGSFLCPTKADGTFSCHELAVTDPRTLDIPLERPAGSSCGTMGCCVWSASEVLCQGELADSGLDWTQWSRHAFQGARSAFVNEGFVCVEGEGGSRCWGRPLEYSDIAHDEWSPPPSARQLRQVGQPCWLDGDELTCVTEYERFTLSEVRDVFTDDVGISAAWCALHLDGTLSCWRPKSTGQHMESAALPERPEAVAGPGLGR